MRMRVEFDNEADGDRIDLEVADVTLMVGGSILAPGRVEDGYVAYYDLPEGIDEAAFAEALDEAAWCHTGFRHDEVAPDPGI